MEEKIKEFKELIEEASNIVFFGGAGVSTASGIPDFRSKDGLYNQKDITFDKYSPEFLLSSECLCTKPKVFFEFYRQKLDVRNIEPNITHYKLAELEKSGKLKAIITQNIDGLHQKAGSKNVIEIHGTSNRNYCMKCNREYDFNTIFDSDDSIVRCECGGIIRPDVTLYGEQLDDESWSKAEQAISECDLLIVAGTSLAVQPAASLTDFFSGKIVVINKDSVALRGTQPLLIIEADMTEVFKEI